MASNSVNRFIQKREQVKQVKMAPEWLEMLPIYWNSTDSNKMLQIVGNFKAKMASNLQMELNESKFQIKFWAKKITWRYSFKFSFWKYLKLQKYSDKIHVFNKQNCVQVNPQKWVKNDVKRTEISYGKKNQISFE